MANNLRVLLVENHPDVAKLFGLMLRTLGHEVTTAVSMKAARQALAGGTFDLMMCDYYLNDGHAVELITEIRKAGLGFKCICVSGVGVDIQRECMAAGFDVFLRKPVTYEVVESTIASLWPPETVPIG